MTLAHVHMHTFWVSVSDPVPCAFSRERWAGVIVSRVPGVNTSIFHLLISMCSGIQLVRALVYRLVGFFVTQDSTILTGGLYSNSCGRSKVKKCAAELDEVRHLRSRKIVATHQFHVLNSEVSHRFVESSDSVYPNVPLSRPRMARARNDHAGMWTYQGLCLMDLGGVWNL